MGKWYLEEHVFRKARRFEKASGGKAQLLLRF
jgi:hypothetical protein